MSSRASSDDRPHPMFPPINNPAWNQNHPEVEELAEDEKVLLDAVDDAIRAEGEANALAPARKLDPRRADEADEIQRTSPKMADALRQLSHAIADPLDPGAEHSVYRGPQNALNAKPKRLMSVVDMPAPPTPSGSVGNLNRPMPTRSVRTGLPDAIQRGKVRENDLVQLLVLLERGGVDSPAFLEACEQSEVDAAQVIAASRYVRVPQDISGEKGHQYAHRDR